MNGLQTMSSQEMEIHKNVRRQLDNVHLRGAQFAFRFGTGCVDQQGRQEARNCGATDNVLEV
jgi:uncharacterized Ntn-hydrolase superfamily protein